MRFGTALTLFICLAILLTACSFGSTNTPTQTVQTTPTNELKVVETEKVEKAVVSATAEMKETQPPLSNTGCPAGSNQPISESAVLELGPGEGVPLSKAEGERMVLTGTIYDSNCMPVEGAVMDVWQTDANGEYGPGHGTDQMKCCYLQGTVRSDANGRFQLITVKPGHYKGESPPPPAHIHVEISHADGEHLETEFVFEGDPYLPPGTEGLTVVTLEEVSDSEGSYLFGTADLVLEP
jgi:protocatechuate 3,4-dioxygenase beta subunit